MKNSNLPLKRDLSTNRELIHNSLSRLQKSLSKLSFNFVFKNRLSGIDRIVPVGEALDIGVIWDGYDIVRSLSRIIDVK